MAQGSRQHLGEQHFQIKVLRIPITVLEVISLRYESLGVAPGKHQVQQVQ
jgi:hypothetical protein